jgi:hypothetical protein
MGYVMRRTQRATLATCGATIAESPDRRETAGEWRADPRVAMLVPVLARIEKHRFHKVEMFRHNEEFTLARATQPTSCCMNAGLTP